MVSTIRERHLLRELQIHVEMETDEARGRFPTALEHEAYGVQMAVLMEEVGKLARAGNKIGLSADEETADRWCREAVLRIIKSISILQRQLLSLHDWPALHAELTWLPDEFKPNG